MNVCLFASSSAHLEDHYYRSAYALGVALAEADCNMVFGGGTEGLMGAAARGIHARNKRVIGVIPEKLNQVGVVYELCDELHVTKTMHERKALMESLSDGFIALPGGYGTLEELMEVLTLKQLAYLDQPIVIYNENGFYDALLLQLHQMEQNAFVREEHKRLYALATTPKDAVACVLSHRYALD